LAEREDATMNQLDFAGRTAAITGGAMGIGLAVAQRLVSGGAKVALWDRDEKALAQAKAALGGSALTWQLDVADASAVSRATQATADAFGGLDILVCSAGITGPNVPLADYPGRRLEARVRRERARGVPVQPRGGAADAEERLRPHRQHRIGRGQGRQSECLRVQRVQGGGDRDSPNRWARSSRKPASASTA
jgi:NAD(P)-dependent dehydrogenase (short-subunit alcohol dehydrogenase family)